MTLIPFGRDIYVRHTNVEGKAYVAHHRVWDADRFIAARQREADALNADQKQDKPRLARVEQITEEQYRKEHTK